MHFLLLFLALPAQAALLTNTGADFQAFLDRAPQVGTLPAWLEFEAKHQEIYQKIVHREGSANWQERRDRRRQTFLDSLPRLQGPMTDLFSRASLLVEQQESKFRGTFNDLRADIPVYFLPSLFTFNGKVSELKGVGKSVVFIGVDAVTDRNDDLDVLFSHEFFHAYHDEKMGKSWRTMASPLWTEGFATYVSGILNPDREDMALLMDPTLSEACADSSFRSAQAALYLRVLAADGPYEDWFNAKPGVLSRVGYCLGLWAVRDIASHHSIQEMVSWGEDRFSAELEASLKKMAGENL